MSKVKAGDTIRIHYHGRLEDGTTFDTSEGREPLSFTVGSGHVIPGFDNGVIDMEVGESKTITIPAHLAYGDKQTELIFDFPKAEFPDEMKPEVGMQLQMMDQEGNPVPVTIIEIKDESVTLDANHFLAGQTLIFDLKLEAIN